MTDPIQKKIKIKPKQRQKIKITPEQLDFDKQAEDLRQKMAEKGYETKTRIKPTAAQLERHKNATRKA